MTEADENSALLWEAFRGGEARALAALFETYYDALYHYGLKLTGDEELVKDCIQNLFQKLWRRREGLRASDQRLNFAQSFNGLGAVVGPLLGSYFILSGANSHVAGDLASVKSLYLAIGSVILVIAVAFSFVKVPPLQDVHASSVHAETEAGFYAGTPETVAAPKGLFQHSHFKWAWVAQFLNVAAQGGTWAFFINYGVEKMHFTDKVAAGYFSLFMVLMMSGRFVGTFLMRYIAPNKLLATFALANVLMCLIVAQSWG